MRLAVVLALFTAAFVAYAAYTGATSIIWYVNAPGVVTYTYSGVSGAYSVCGISASYKYTPDTSAAAGELWLGAVPRIAVIDGACYKFGAYNETFLLIDYVNKVAYLVVLDSPAFTYRVYAVPYTSIEIYSNFSSNYVFRFSAHASLRLFLSALNISAAPGAALLLWAPFGQYVTFYVAQNVLHNASNFKTFIAYVGNTSLTRVEYKDIYGNVYTVAPPAKGVLICALGGCRVAMWRQESASYTTTTTHTVTAVNTTTVVVTTTYVNTVYEQLPTGGGNTAKWIAIIGGTAVVLMLLAVLLSRR